MTGQAKRAEASEVEAPQLARASARSPARCGAVIHSRYCATTRAWAAGSPYSPGAGRNGLLNLDGGVTIRLSGGFKAPR
jgi:hypothetical protein